MKLLLAVLLTAGSLHAAEPPVTAVAFTLDGKQIVAGSQAGIVVHDWPGLKLVRKLQTKIEQVHDLRFSPDGKLLLAAGGTPGEEGKVEIYDWGRANRVSNRCRMRRRCFALSGLCAANASSTQGGACGFAATLCPGLICSSPFRARISEAILPDTYRARFLEVFRPDRGSNKPAQGNALGQGCAPVEEALKGRNRDAAKPPVTKGPKPRTTFAHHEDLVYAVAWRPDSKGFVAASLDHSVALYDVAKSKPVKVLNGHSRGVKAVAILPDGKTLISGGIDNSLRVWSLPKGKAARTFNNHTRPIHDMAVRPTPPGPPLPRGGIGRLPMLVSVSDDRTIRLWQPTIGRMVRFARLKKAAPLAVRWTPTGDRIVVACSDGRVRIMDPDTAEITHNLLALKSWAYCLAVHPKGKEVAVGGKGGKLVRIAMPQ